MPTTQRTPREHALRSKLACTRYTYSAAELEVMLKSKASLDQIVAEFEKQKEAEKACK